MSIARKWAALAALLGLIGSAQAGAGVVYDGGAPDQVSGNEMTEWIQANQFTLGSAATITDVRFWDIEASGAYNGSLVWQIYSDSSGSPGALLDSGSTSAVSHVATGNTVLGRMDRR